MTTQEKLVQKKLTLLELGEYLQNVSEACRISGCSRRRRFLRRYSASVFPLSLTNSHSKVRIAGEVSRTRHDRRSGQAAAS